MVPEPLESLRARAHQQGQVVTPLLECVACKLRLHQIIHDHGLNVVPCPRCGSIFARFADAVDKGEWEARRMVAMPTLRE